MGHTRRIGLLWILLTICVATISQAANLTTSITVGATYDSSGNVQSSTGLIDDGAPHILRLDFFALLSGVAANESYGAEELSITLNGSFSRNTLLVAGPGLLSPKPNFVFNNPPIDGNLTDIGTSLPVSNYFVNAGDFGSSSTDLSGIVWAVDPKSVGNLVDSTTFAPVQDPRLSIGIGTPFRLGSLYVNWTGGHSGGLRLQSLQFTTVNLQTHLFTLPVQNYPDLVFAIAEPATLWSGAFGIGLLMLCRVARLFPSRSNSSNLKN
jgi:hypothetical protein